MEEEREEEGEEMEEGDGGGVLGGGRSGEWVWGKEEERGAGNRGKEAQRDVERGDNRKERMDPVMVNDSLDLQTYMKVPTPE